MARYEYAIIVKSKTRLEVLIERFNTRAQARFYIEHQGGDFNDYEEEDKRFQIALQSVQTQLSKYIKNKIVDRQYVSSFLFSEKHLIVVIGQDGLVANTAKYANGCPIIGVNPDGDRYDGILLPFSVSDCMEGVDAVMSDKHSMKTVGFAEARLSDGQRLLAFNDLFIGTCSHVSARYRISFNQNTEEHSSSGIIVSTAAGATGWLSSIFNMAYGVVGMYEKNLSPKHPTLKENELLFAVREPFASVRTQTGINMGIICEETGLTINSMMPVNGVIFSDGIENDFLQFNSGAVVKIGMAKERAVLVST